MYIITEELELENTALFIEATTPTNNKVNQVVALASQLDASNTAIQKALGAIQILLVRGTDVPTLNQVKNIAIELINGSSLLAETKANYLHTVQAVAPQDNAFPYKRKYDSAAQIEKHLATTSTRKEIASLYYVNATLIEQTPALQNAFTARKAKFYPLRKSVA